MPTTSKMTKNHCRVATLKAAVRITTEKEVIANRSTH